MVRSQALGHSQKDGVYLPHGVSPGGVRGFCGSRRSCGLAYPALYGLLELALGGNGHKQVIASVDSARHQQLRLNTARAGLPHRGHKLVEARSGQFHRYFASPQRLAALVGVAWVLDKAHHMQAVLGGMWFRASLGEQRKRWSLEPVRLVHKRGITGHDVTAAGHQTRHPVQR